MAKHSIRDLMDIAYEAAKENFGKLSFNFASLWAKTWAKAKEFKKDSIENWIGSFYTELLIDPRFVYVGTRRWRLREFMDYGEYLREVGKRAQDVQFSDPDVTEGETKEKVEVKKRGPRGRKGDMSEPTTAETLAAEVETQESPAEEHPETEEVNLDEDIESSTPPRQQESEEDEDNYD